MNKYANQEFNEQLLASSMLAERNIRVLKNNETFAIFDRYGDITTREHGELGVYHEGTRFLSKSEFRIDGKKPLLLSSFITDDNATLTIDLTNPELEDGRIPSGAIHITRTIFLWNSACYEHFGFQNFLDTPVAINSEINHEADYHDIFEVRGHHRSRRGKHKSPRDTNGCQILSYVGLDGIERYTVASLSPKPMERRHDGLRLHIKLPAKGIQSTELTYHFGSEKEPAIPQRSFADAFRELKDEISIRRSRDAIVSTSNEQFNDLVNRSIADTHLLVTETETGPYPFAGVPWFNAPFGRDGIITALELLWVNPQFAKAVLHFLSETQAKEVDPTRDAEPGKIIHEARHGEMANLGEIPFKQYYGSVDSTPLFIMLAGGYFKRTGDKKFLQQIWPNVKAAIRWLEEFGDSNDDGFIDYHRLSQNGLVHQGWKDSDNSVFHSNGDLAKSPISLCEVQGYTYFAFKRAAYLAKAMGEDQVAADLDAKRLRLREKFNKEYWVDELQYFALALDKDNRPCAVKSSNVGHCLFSGIIDRKYASQVADVLMSPEMFSGWGVRTIGNKEELYNPMSYHNGTVWPHDCAIVGAGLARYGFKEHCIRIMTGLFDASNLVDFHRLPELFCGFSRAPGRNPTNYPVSCAPQAWSAAAIFLLLGSCLGIKVNGAANEVLLFRPQLPPYLDSVTVRNLEVNTNSKVDLCFVNHGEDVGVNILKRDKNAKIVVIK